MSKRDIVLWSGITAAVVGVVAAVSVTTQIVRTRRYEADLNARRRHRVRFRDDHARGFGSSSDGIFFPPF